MAPEPKDGGPARGVSQLIPSSLTRDCKTALYQSWSRTQAGVVLGRTEEAVKITGVVQGPDIGIDSKESFDEDK